MNLLLAVGVEQWVLFGVLVLMLVGSVVAFIVRNKKDAKNAQQVSESIKKGDKILTTTGVIGKVVGIETKDGFKQITIETGDEKHKGYLSMDISAVYVNLSSVPAAQPKVESKENTEPEKVAEPEKVEDIVVKEEPKVEDAQKDAKPAKKAKTTTKKSSKK